MHMTVSFSGRCLPSALTSPAHSSQTLPEHVIFSTTASETPEATKVPLLPRAARPLPALHIAGRRVCCVAQS